MLVQKIFGSKQFWVQNILVHKYLWSNKILGPNNYVSKTIWDLGFLVKHFFGQTKLVSQTKYCLRNLLAQEIFWVQGNFQHQTNFESKNNFRSKTRISCFNVKTNCFILISLAGIEVAKKFGVGGGGDGFQVATMSNLNPNCSCFELSWGWVFLCMMSFHLESNSNYCQ